MELDATLLLLAGGLSRRMGRPKPLLPVGDTTLAEWVVHKLAPDFRQLLVAAPGEEGLPPELHRYLVRDVHLGAGPLAGIEAGLAAATYPVMVAVACDMPAVTPALLRRLVAAIDGYDAAVPRVGGRPEPTCAAYAPGAAGPIAAALGAGRYRAGDALAELDVRWLDGEDPGQFVNLNTPAEYRRFLDAPR